MKRRLALSVLLLMAFAATARAGALPEAFVDALEQAGIPLANVAVVIEPLDATSPLVSHNAGVALNPASAMKLVTSFAALDRLGTGYAWTTRVWADGPLVDGVLDGNLVVQGRGDPTLTLERMWLLQRALRARGVHHIRGKLVLDTRDFDVPPADPGAFDNAPLAPYNAPPGALVANFNTIPLRIIPTASTVQIVPEVELPGVTFTSQVVATDDAECNGARRALVPVPETGERTGLTVTGRYARSCGEQTWALNLFPPETTFDLIFRGLWQESGGTLAGATVAGAAPAGEPLLTFSSAPLPVALTQLNKFSNNLMTRNLFLTLGAAAYGAPATLEKADRAIRETLDRRGIATQQLVLENGAGLSRIERISAQALAQLLRAAHSSPWFPEFAASMPIVATDGTLKRRFADSPAAGQAHLKTGRLRDVRALAGYVHTVDNRRVILVLLINDAQAPLAEDAQQALLEWVWAGDGEKPRP